MLFTCILCSALYAQPTSSLNEQWLNHITEKVVQSEYNIQPHNQQSQYTSPNRLSDFRVSYDKNGFLLQDRTHKQAWKFGLSLAGIQQGESLLQANALTAQRLQENQLVFDQGTFEVEYINSPKGMRQNFLIKEAPTTGNAPIVVRLNIEGNMEVVCSQEDGVLFRHESTNKEIWYKDLNVWDANHQTLPAHMEIIDDEVQLWVDASTAQYPIMIDPLSVSADWTAEGGQTNAGLGISVSGAGDVNRDGYSDVLVGVHLYDGGQVDEGKALLFFGSSTGVSNTADWEIESNQVGAQLGYSLSNAGDVNGDGYGDIILGIPHYSDVQANEGRVQVYFGSASGPGTAADWAVESNQADAEFGHTVALAGDVNADGYSDIIIGSPFYDNGEANEGRAFIYHGGATGLSGFIAWTAEINQADAEFGHAVAPAGDVNGDGYSDVLVGAWKYDNGETDEGKAYLYYGSVSGVAGSPAWGIESNQADAQLANSLCSAGDINGDGYSDILIGTHLYDNGETDEGSVSLYFGGSSGPASAADWSIESNQAGAHLGSSVSLAGDINGDGLGDMIIGASHYDHGESDEGIVYVYQGLKTALSSVPLWTFESNTANALLGNAVSYAGDVNGDGFGDVLVGAPGYSGGETGEGKAYLFHGGANELATTPDWTGSDLVDNAVYGQTVASAGDLNGDGFADVLIGSSEYSNGETNEGAAYVYYGSETGLNSNYDWRFEPNMAGVTLGISGSGLGDVNGDGYADLAVSAPRYSNGEAFEGIIYVFYGSPTGIANTPDWQYEPNATPYALGASVSGAGDVNGDGFMDLIVSGIKYANEDSAEGIVHVFYGSETGLSNTPNWSAEGNSVDSGYGVRVGCAGDVNGDGFSDVFVGAYLYSDTDYDGGKAFVYYGSASGPSTNPDWVFGTNGNPGAWVGLGLACVGDVNGDGYSDVAVGAPFFDVGPMADAGKIWVFMGGASGLETTASWEKTGNIPSATLSRVAGAGDVNGDGYEDIILGSPFYSNPTPLGGLACIHLGSENGLESTPHFEYAGTMIQGLLGSNVASAGDVNGDGFSDVLIAARGHTVTATKGGAAYLFCGGSGGPIRNNPAQYQAQSTNVLSVGSAIQEGAIDLALFQKGSEGRQKGRLVWELVSNPEPFSHASPITNSTQFTGIQNTYTDLGLTGTELRANLPSFDTGDAQRWRVRTQFSPSSSLTGQVYSPWRYYFNLEPNTPGISFLRESTPFPVELLYFAGWQEGMSAKLEWRTAQETNNKGFYPQHAPIKDGGLETFEDRQFIPGAGTSSDPRDYTYIVSGLNPGRHAFRLKQEDFNGVYNYSHVIEVMIIASESFSVAFPNPFPKGSHIGLSVKEDQYVNVQLVGINGAIHPLFQGSVKAGVVQNIAVNGNITSGMYILRITGESFVDESYKVIITN